MRNYNNHKNVPQHNLYFETFTFYSESTNQNPLNPTISDVNI